jgi:peptidyl-prolyl cis-trans isomerase SurA
LLLGRGFRKYAGPVMSDSIIVRASRRGFGRLFVLSAVTAATVAALACGSKPAAETAKEAAKEPSADTWAVVDGREITRQDVEKAYRRTRDASTPSLSFEDEMPAKLALLDNLIVQDLLMAKASALKLDVPASELDTAFADAQKNIPPATFQQELAQRGLTAADMRESLRRDLLTQKVLNQEVGSRIKIGDQDVTAFFNANRAQYNVPEESYHLAQIVVTPTRDAQVTNGTGDDATTPEAAVAKVKMLMERLKSGASFRDLAVGYSEDPDSAPRGGDLGLVPVSRIKQAPPAMRDAVLNKAAGAVNVVNNGNAYALLLVVAHEPAGQRDLSTPGVRDRITEQLRGRREALLRAAYLTALRSDAQVVNYLARRLIASNGTPPPSMPLAAPGKP